MGDNRCGWNCMKMGENGWKWMKVDESGWKWMKVDENGWKWLKVDENVFGPTRYKSDAIFYLSADHLPS